jgi:hypothetical protein
MEIGLMSVPNYIEPLQLTDGKYGVIRHAQEADLHISGCEIQNTMNTCYSRER